MFSDLHRHVHEELFFVQENPPSVVERKLLMSGQLRSAGRGLFVYGSVAGLGDTFEDIVNRILGHTSVPTGMGLYLCL